eukprot:GFUD01031513.1.p1 GENE.GFUD01031513.1~~GFUD01031513.1.p1  ORF type:complete len:298 (+),score=88.09 GFUD01031513.1:122-1015(+)
MESTDSGSLPTSPINPSFNPGVEFTKQTVNVQVKQSTEFHGDPGDTYRVRSNPKGWVLLINNEKFESETFSTRLGSEVDERNLEALFIQLGFKVLVRRNLKKDEMRRELNSFSDLDDHLASDMAVVCICSHGLDNGKIITSDCKEIDVREDIMRKFNNEECKNLKGKPKMFIFQACRGSEKDFGIIENNREPTRSLKSTGVDAIQFKKVPTWEDMLIVYSTIPGYVAIRNHFTGAWFVQSFCKVLMEKSHNTDVRRMLDGVAWELREFQGEEGHVESCTYESLNFYKQLFFNPGMFE